MSPKPPIFYVNGFLRRRGHGGMVMHRNRSSSCRSALNWKRPTHGNYHCVSGCYRHCRTACRVRVGRAAPNLARTSKDVPGFFDGTVAHRPADGTGPDAHLDDATGMGAVFQSGAQAEFSDPSGAVIESVERRPYRWDWRWPGRHCLAVAGFATLAVEEISEAFLYGQTLEAAGSTP